MQTNSQSTITQINSVTCIFILALIMSGFTAIPAKSEIAWLLKTLPSDWVTIHEWLSRIHVALWSVDEALLYGYDWLAFAHIVIGICFIGVLKNPVQNIWVVEFGMIACLLIFPFAAIMGNWRGIPIWWQFVDMSFGLLGIIPLWFLHNRIKTLEHQLKQEQLNILF